MLNRVLDSNNQLFELARQGSLAIPRFHNHIWQNIWEFAYPLLAFFYAGLVPVLSSFCAAPVIVVNLASENFSVAAFHNPLKTNSPLITSMFLLFSFLPFFVFIWGWLGIFEHRSFWTTGLERTNIREKYLRGAAVGTLMMIMPVFILWGAGLMNFESDPYVWSGWSAIPGVLIMLVGWLVQGAAEETLTRGFLLPVFGIRFGPFWGIMVSSILFSSLHLLNQNLNWIAMVNLFLFGVFASLYAMREGGLWGVFAIHSFWNWTQGNLFGLEVSGSSIGGTTLINLQETGSNLLTGGAFGPEGGLAVSFILVASILVMFLIPRRKELPAFLHTDAMK
ncbi:CPBP family intramembrane glutamic endopeptidase [Leptolinea tardivitalis]|uniref:CPBP family intramembrane glutamic endopeptidase n=1 Tax=Leptolinea tardivitalis TaxID=229920 RepID=UPI0007851741|nr:CPBP family intramembrane glutamic endopeptidase [Leptolinea tardivitalis]GAP22116.1 predicted metal-dependent membrane protease [Leptolinea tardivitalis]